MIYIRCRACRTMVLGQTEMSVVRSSFNRSASSAARTRSQCGPSEDLVIGCGRFFDAIMLLVNVGFSFTRQRNSIRCGGDEKVSCHTPSDLSIPL